MEPEVTSRQEQGLSGSEAAARLKRFGPNELPRGESRSFARIAFGVARQPMFALLLSGALVYFFLGESLDALVLSIFATLSLSIGIAQENRSERVLQSLRDLASPRALVWRDGRQQRVAARELVPGDIIVLVEGDRLAADAQILTGNGLLADESLLTGESLPVRKKPSPHLPGNASPGDDDLPLVFAGTLLVRGNGTARVTATGARTEMGKIGHALASISLEQPGLQKQLRWLVRDFALAGLGVAALVVLLRGLSSGSWLQAALGGIAIGMSMLPEEIPLVLAVFMAMGAWRISRAGVLTRRASAIETLGSATVLCTDKTGTLTQNHMAVALLATNSMEWRRNDVLGPQAEEVLQAALAASAPIPTDPMDRAIHEVALEAELATPPTLLHSYGLQPEFPATTNIWNGGTEMSAAAYAKGAPETIAGLCRLTPPEHARLIQDSDRFAAQGIRLLAVARADLAWHEGSRPQTQQDIPFRYLGLIGFADALRSTVPAAVRQCGEAGIRVMMITGDYPATARAIARQAGIDAASVVTGVELEAMDDRALAQAARNTCIFARIKPQQKLRLVEILKRDGEIVAMTGDGVNDAPAMKAAHIGIAMGLRGTDVAREASALVLLKDDFASIVTAIRLGRRIYDNLRKAIEYIVAVHIPIAGLALLPLLFGMAPILLPLHIALLEMVIDPACSIIFEAEKDERDVMRQPPRAPGTPVLPRSAVLWAGSQGLAALGLVALAFAISTRSGATPEGLRAFVFTVLVLMNVGLILVNRSHQASLRQALLRPNRSLWILTAAALAVLGTALYWPPAQGLFGFAPLQAGDLLLCLFAEAALLTGLELLKGWMSRRGIAH